MSGSSRIRRPALAVVFFSFGSLLTLGSHRGAEAQPAEADLVLRGGAIYTVDAARSWAQAVAIRDATIVFVGDDDGVLPFIGPRTEVVALDGRMVLPGFHDSHLHPVSGGIELGQCDLNGLVSEREILDAIAACAEDQPESSTDDSWIVGGGWDLTVFAGGNPHRELLDRVVPGRAVYLSAADGHSSWVSSRALELAGVDKTTPDPPPDGRIERDPKTGEATGTLRESAMGLVQEILPPLDYEEYVQGLERSLQMANRYGITSWIEARASDDETLRAYTELSRSGRLTARTRVSLEAYPAQDESQVDELLARSRSFSGAYLRADAVKIFADGVIEARTAALLEPYVGMAHNGALNFEVDALNELVARIDGEGLQVHIHAIGDRAIRASLDALEFAREQNGRRDARHHIAHLELFDPADIPRFRQLGVVANFQPLWAYADTYITDLTIPVLGPERSRWLYPIGSVVASGATVVGGSDWSVSSMNPLDAIQVGMTRKGNTVPDSEPWIPQERVDLPTMLALYTINGAYLHHQETRTGSIEPGKAADLIVLESNLFEIAPETIHDVAVLLTLLDGREVFRHESYRPDNANALAR